MDGEVKTYNMRKYTNIENVCGIEMLRDRERERERERERGRERKRGVAIEMEKE